MPSLLSSRSDNRPIELSFSMILRRVEFSSFVYSASFAVIPAQYTSIPGASEGKSERTKNKREAKVARRRVRSTHHRGPATT
jgi:hypothetical protein